MRNWEEMWKHDIKEGNGRENLKMEAMNSVVQMEQKASLIGKN